MPDYDSALFTPPAPLARVVLRNPESGATQTDVPMLLDTGADVSLIPQASISSLALATISDTRYELVGFDGNSSFAQVVRVELIFLERTFRGQFLLTGQDWGILGRNILNAIPLLFDGPRLRWELPTRNLHERDISRCPDCHGTGYMIIPGKGARRCDHKGLDKLEANKADSDENSDS